MIRNTVHDLSTAGTSEGTVPQNLNHVTNTTELHSTFRELFASRTALTAAYMYTVATMDGLPTCEGPAVSAAGSEALAACASTAADSQALREARRKRQRAERLARVQREREREINRIRKAVRQQKGPTAVLGVAPDASTGECRRAYMHLVRLVHSDKLFAETAGQVPDRFSSVFLSVQQAYASVQAGSRAAAQPCDGVSVATTVCHHGGAAAAPAADAPSRSRHTDDTGGRVALGRVDATARQHAGTNGGHGPPSVTSHALVPYAARTAIAAYTGPAELDPSLWAAHHAIAKCHSVGAEHTKLTGKARAKIRHQNGIKQRQGARKRALRRLERHGFAFSVKRRPQHVGDALPVKVVG